MLAPELIFPKCLSVTRSPIFGPTRPGQAIRVVGSHSSLMGITTSRTVMAAKNSTISKGIAKNYGTSATLRKAAGCLTGSGYFLKQSSHKAGKSHPLKLALSQVTKLPNDRRNSYNHKNEIARGIYYQISGCSKGTNSLLLYFRPESNRSHTNQFFKKLWVRIGF